ncbi:hypothetical protein ETH98_09050 [Macrococcoides caseolyticum]|uniref:hypothetical protein n=1 Tax=Macrococcoides caseolyticum TaxID=69966 RepID=UPI00105D9232|nr:hypothetical protein [Macrococcus caseolyticus]QQB04603.1 hypothetical protein I6H62_06105 [Macrococcus caseolyticus]TDM28645.1 hypothetical protein ETH98_09050 [Macrococcus caseolyticus]
MRHIKRKPKQFVLIVILTLVYSSIHLYGNDHILWSIVYCLLIFIMWMTFFITTSDEEEMNRLLDLEVKRLNMPSERLYQVTGYNRYEVSKSEDGQIIFWIPMSKKKVLLKKLKGMEPGQE